MWSTIRMAICLTLMASSAWAAGEVNQAAKCDDLMSADDAKAGELKKSCPLNVTRSEIGDVQVGKADPSGKIPLVVSVGKRQLLFELDGQNVRLSAKSKAELKKKPLRGAKFEREPFLTRCSAAGLDSGARR